MNLLEDGRGGGELEQVGCCAVAFSTAAVLLPCAAAVLLPSQRLPCCYLLNGCSAVAFSTAAVAFSTAVTELEQGSAEGHSSDNVPITRAFEEQVAMLNSKSLYYVPFDFHRYCSKMRYDRLWFLLNHIEALQHEFGYFARR